MKFVSFNINGLRAHIHQLEAIITILKPDIIGLQEIKVHDSMFPIDKILNYGYHVYYYGQKKYYGVALLSRKKPLSVYYGLNISKNDTQRRVIIADFNTSEGLLTIINVYFPQGSHRNHPIKFLYKECFYKDIQYYIEYNYVKESLLLIIGDMNISPTDFDIGIGKENYKNWLYYGKCSFLPEERIWIKKLFKWGLVDTYRYIHPTKNDRYSWFDYRLNSFYKNRGLRIDLLLASKKLVKFVHSSDIDYTIRSMNKPSDHAPVWTNFNIKLL